jgi:hypothetical protein
MKLHVFVIALAAVALAAPVEAASKKRSKGAHRAATHAVQPRPSNGSHDVYVSGELVGRDPDPFIRSMMRRNPHPWDGPQ